MEKNTHFTANTRLARCVMVLGTTSGAGKSWLTTALCRYYSNLGTDRKFNRMRPSMAGFLGDLTSLKSAV